MKKEILYWFEYSPRQGDYERFYFLNKKDRDISAMKKALIHYKEGSARAWKTEDGKYIVGKEVEPYSMTIDDHMKMEKEKIFNSALQKLAKDHDLTRQDVEKWTMVQGTIENSLSPEEIDALKNWAS